MNVAQLGSGISKLKEARVECRTVGVVELLYLAVGACCAAAHVPWCQPSLVATDKQSRADDLQ